MYKLALVFSGQGSQYIGMGKALCRDFGVAAQTFEEADSILGFNLSKMCFEGDIDELTRTENTQPAILTASAAAFRVFMKEFGMVPKLLAGHSLGEISALTCTGAMRFEDAVRIARQRGIFMQEAAAPGVGAMAAISGIDKDIISEKCSSLYEEDNFAVISNYNSVSQTIVSGHKNAVERLSDEMQKAGAKVTFLKVSAPFHSPLMEAAAVRLKEELERYTYGEFKWPVISNVDALPYSKPEQIIEKLTLQVTHPVQWLATMKHMQEYGIGLVVELGAQAVLKRLFERSLKNITALSFDNKEDIQILGDISKKDNVYINTVVTKCLSTAVCTRNRNWDNEEYQKGMVEPYRKIQAMQKELEEKKQLPDTKQMKEALQMLKKVFETKKTPIDEQIERFNEIFDETGTRDIFSDFTMPHK